MSRKSEVKSKHERRLRRKRHVRRRVFGEAEQPRLTVFRSHRHMSCQLIDDFRGVTLAAASTTQKSVQAELGGIGAGFGGNAKAASLVGKLISERAKALGIERVRFDRNGYRYHGRVKALAEAAREGGLKL